MESLPVTLIVKAPNQQIEDQTVKCELSWTINKLKHHLSEVYPSKPPKHEQKLIYSGQLLNDSLVLKDVLRQYEGQETHTVHLVCTPKQESTPPRQNMPSTVPTTASEHVNRSTSTPDNRQNIQNFGNMSMPWFPEGFQMDPQYAAQMAVMQQAYMQYMNQYMQLAANTYRYTPYQQNPATPPIPNVQAPQAAPQPNPQNENGAEAAPQAPVRRPVDQENNDRDWLDNFYTISRLLVFFSVVYFYSSFLRFSLVLILGLSIYLYQVGFFRHINNNNNNNNTVPGDQSGAPQEEQAPSRLTLVWTFFTTFFASLLPEVPNAV
ncbi:hypothetical protein WA026_013430 [Henosepilachna vigintioctopunctata]|uniref:Ubiquitin-like domain-containing protein n=1 Tax=Henosepilachna vigintioctopunctata TaxID=420089 RepID=A0AAW1VDF3_9CUCU